MDKVLVTGGTGFVGFWMRQCIPNSFYCHPMNHFDYRDIDWDIFDCKYIVHLANVEPSHAINYAKRHNARLLYCSSGIVYHPENDTEYRRNKIKWEQECLDSGVDVVIARLFTFYGEGLDDGKAIVQFEKAERSHQPIHIWGDGTCTRSYMHGSELGKWLWAILLHGERGEAYDVGSDEPVTMLELAKRFSEDIIFERDKHVPMPTYLPVDTAKTRKLLEK